MVAFVANYTSDLEEQLTWALEVASIVECKPKVLEQLPFEC